MDLGLAEVGDAGVLLLLLLLPPVLLLLLSCNSITWPLPMPHLPPTLLLLLLLLAESPVVPLALVLAVAAPGCEGVCMSEGA